jgi:hypothetical protein
VLFIFRPEHMIGLANGTLKQVASTNGVPLGLVRDAVTGQFAGHAVGLVSQPFLAVPQILMGAAQMYQTHRGFQKTYRMLDNIQSSLGVLQTTTAVIGVGVAAGVALSAVNLYQTLKLREDVKQLRLEVESGFIDLKQVLKNQSQEILARIDSVAQDVEFNHHRTILAQAYGDFVHAVSWLKDTLHSSDWKSQNATIANIQGMLQKSLSAYNNPAIYQQTSAAGKLRRLECAWTIEQTITFTYQLKEEYSVVNQRLNDLQNRIKSESLKAIDSCSSQEELDFLAPELTKINRVDIPMLKTWQGYIDWQQVITPEEQKELLELPGVDNDLSIIDSTNDNNISFEKEKVPEEIKEYETLKQKSHYNSLLDQVRFIIAPELRRDRESYISQKASAMGYHAIASPPWQDVPDFTVANLYWYFQEQ